MREFVLSAPAHRDWLEIWDFIAKDNADAADRMVERIERAGNLLAENPHIGVERTDIGREPVRLWLIGSFWLVYRAETTPLEILRVVHTARDLDAMFGDS